MDIRAQVLADNTVYGAGPIAEHGWAVWFETGEGDFLFDTGQGKALLHNATHYRRDLGMVQGILISHHHYDHTGGLLAALRVMQGGWDGSGVPVYAHYDLFKESYAIPKGKPPRHIGIPFSRAALEGAGAVFDLSNGWREVAEGIALTGQVPRQTDFEQPDPDLKQFNPSGELVVDPVMDDQALVIETRRGLVIVLGCSHAGVINVLSHVRERTGRSDFHTVIGGTHLDSADAERVARTVIALRQFDIRRIGISHCTGPRAAAEMARAFGDRFFFCKVGTVVEV